MPFDGIDITPDGGAHLLMLYCGPRRFGASATRSLTGRRAWE